MRELGVFLILTFVLVGGGFGALSYLFGNVIGCFKGCGSFTPSVSETYGWEARRALTETLDATMTIADIPNTAPSDDPIHRFYGRVSADHGGACLVNFRSAIRRTQLFAIERNAFGLGQRTKYATCADFARVTPPNPGPRFTPLPPLEKEAYHMCAPTIGTPRYLWDEMGPTTDYLSLATLAKNVTAEDLAARAFDMRPAKATREARTDAGEVLIPVGPIRDNTTIQPLATLHCDGFTLFHVEINATTWPRPTQQ